jgi:hypothetical protein
MSTVVQTISEEVTVGKARDFDITLTPSSGSLVVADIVDVWLTVKERDTDADADALIAKRLGSGITLTGVSGSSVTGIASLTNANTAELAAGRTYFVDLQVETTSRGAEQAAYGFITTRQPITVSNS